VVVNFAKVQTVEASVAVAAALLHGTVAATLPGCEKEHVIISFC
jgi:hypothetical protein